MSSKRQHMLKARSNRAELEHARKQVHSRSRNESTRPKRELRMSSWDLARSISMYDRRAFEERPLSWMGVRGTQYADTAYWSHTSGRWFETWGELVPEPTNVHDSFAVAIDLEGARLGYAPARYARYAHTYVSTLNSLGDRVLVPLRFRVDFARNLRLPIARALAAMPTLNEFSRHLPTDEELSKLFLPIWDALDEDVKVEIASNRYHLTKETLTAITGLRHLGPGIGLPEEPILQAVPRGISYFLRQQRLNARRADALERKARDDEIVSAFHDGWRQIDIARRLGVSDSVVHGALKKAGVNTRAQRVTPVQRRTNDEIVRMECAGRARWQIIYDLGVTAQTIARATAAAGLDAMPEAERELYWRGKSLERLELCRRAHDLEQSGTSVSAIAEQIETSVELTTIYLEDGRFVNDPGSSPDRLVAAREERFGRSTWRAIQDAEMLDLAGAPWR